MWWLMSAAMAAPCNVVSIEDVAQVTPPTVLVLGERHGHRADLRRAGQLLRALQRRNIPVSIALEAITESAQDTLAAYNADDLGLGQLRTAVDWDNSWGYAFKPYKRFFKADAPLIAAGPPLQKAPEDAVIAIPEGYAETLSAAFSGHLPPGQEIDPEMLASFTRSMAWRDLRIAELAYAGWDQTGVLLIVTGRGHVEGDMGTNWQLRNQYDTPVESVILGLEDAKCAASDRILN